VRKRIKFDEQAVFRDLYSYSRRSTTKSMELASLLSYVTSFQSRYWFFDRDYPFISSPLATRSESLKTSCLLVFIVHMGQRKWFLKTQFIISKNSKISNK